MKVLRVITWLPHGGIERRLATILPRLRDGGEIEPEIACIRERGPLADELEASGIPVHEIKFKRRWDFGAINKLRKLIVEREIELVHAHMYRSNVPATVAAKLAGVPMLGQIHNVDTWDTPRQRKMDRFLAKYRAGMLAVSSRVAKDVETTLQLPPEKVHVLYNGVELADFEPDDARRWKMREELDLANDAIAVVNPARLHSQKNHAGLIRSWARAMEKLPEDIRRRSILLLAGEGGARAEIETQIGDLTAEGKIAEGSIRLLGQVSAMSDLYRAADVMTLPSFKEGFSNALVEAMASELPIIATDVGGNAEAIEDGKSGFITRPGDDDDLTEALVKILSDDETRRQFGAAARERSRLFSLDVMIDKTAVIYRRVLEESRG